MTTRRRRPAATKPKPTAPVIESDIVDAEIVDEDPQPVATTPGTALAVRQRPAALAYGSVDGDTITVQLTASISGYGSDNDILTLVQTPQVDALLAAGYMVLYTGPNPPAPQPQALTTAAQTLTGGQQTQVQNNLGIPALLSTNAALARRQALIFANA